MSAGGNLVPPIAKVSCPETVRWDVDEHVIEYGGRVNIAGAAVVVNEAA